MRKIKLFSLLAVLLVTCFTSTAWAWSGSGTENDPYLISSVADWNTLSTNSQSNTYAGVYFRLMNDLSVGTMIGSESNETGRFAGIFDGNIKEYSFLMLTVFIGIVCKLVISYCQRESAFFRVFNGIG